MICDNNLKQEVKKQIDKFNYKLDKRSGLNLKNLKESYPIEVAEYAVANRIVNEHALKW